MHDVKDQLSARQGQGTCWDACESAVLDVGWRRSVGVLFGAHCGFWHGGTATCRLRMPGAHAACASADSWAWSVSPQDPRPFLRHCFPSVADLAKKGIDIADWERH